MASKRTCTRNLGNGYSAVRRRCKKRARWKIVNRRSGVTEYRCGLHYHYFDIAYHTLEYLPAPSESTDA